MQSKLMYHSKHLSWGQKKKMTSDSAPCDLHEYRTGYTGPENCCELSSFQPGSLTATVANKIVTGVFKDP